MPSEAEWEYACRAGKNTEYCGGDKLDTVAWYDKNSGEKTHTVGQKQANAWGLYDMSGNLWEWVQDYYSEDYNGAPTDGSSRNSPVASVVGLETNRVLRGGSWFNEMVILRVAYRNDRTPSEQGQWFGFRLARTLP